MGSESVRKRKGRVIPQTEDADDDGRGDRDAARNKDGGRFKLLCLLAVLVTLLLPPLLLLIVDIFVPSPIEPVYYSLPDPPALEGSLQPNHILTQAERLFEGQLRGPESLVMHQGHLYTGTADGKIVCIYNGVQHTVASIGTPPCGGFDDEPTCGRPLGMRFDRDGYLIVADAYLGLFKVNVVTGDVFTLYPSTEKIQGHEPKLLNDLDIARDGTIYMTDSSTKWDRRHNRLQILENSGLGRLLKYDPETNTTTVLADGLHFANGVQLSPKEDYLLVTETGLCRILRYNLQGPKAGTLEVFTDNLPGLPDNIRRRRGSNSYWVAMAAMRSWSFEFAGPRPWIRRLFSKLFGQETLLRIITKPYGLILEVDSSGKIIRSLHDPTGNVIPSVSEVEEDDGVLYLGSYQSPFLGRIKLRKAPQS